MSLAVGRPCDWAGRVLLIPARILSRVCFRWMRPTPHAFLNPADQPVRLLETISLAGFERYFADLADICPVLDPRSRGSWRHLPAATVSTSTSPPYPGWPPPTG
jgi:hypothetical protein